MMLQLRKWDKTMIKGLKVSENMLYALVHKSYIISLQHIAEVNRSRIILDNGDDVPIGDLYRDRLNEYIQQKFLDK